MLKHTFAGDPLTRKVIRYFLILLLAEFIPVILISFTHLARFALMIVFLTSIIFLCMLFWLYYRYQSHPLVREKRALEQQKSRRQVQIRSEDNKITASRQIRKNLSQAESTETAEALQNLQEAHIKAGLAAARIADAQIPGIGAKLKERLAAHAIVTAANIRPDSLSSLAGFGEAKSNAIIAWRDEIYSRFDKTKPAMLPTEKVDQIWQNYQAQHASNDGAESKAKDNKFRLEEELGTLLPRLDQLTAIKFGNYLRHVISPKRGVAGIAMLVLMFNLLCVGAAISLRSLASSVPTATLIPTPDNSALQREIVETASTNATSFASTPTLLPTFTPTHTSTPTNAIAAVETNTPMIPVTGNCDPGDQTPYVYSPDRLKVLADCIHVTGIVEEIRKEADGDLHILLKLDLQYTYLLTPANSNERGDLVVEPICVNQPTQADAIEPCSRDPDPLNNLPGVGQHVWMEGRYVTDSDHGGWAEIHPLARWGMSGETVTQPTIVIPAHTLAVVPTAITGNRVRIGAICVDGTTSNATGSGACSHHGGVRCWQYSDGTCTKP